MFGDRSWDPIVIRIIIVAKSIIFKNKQIGKSLALTQVIFSLKNSSK